MSIEYEDRIIQERAEDEKKERLRNRKNERKHRKRRLRMAKLRRNRYVGWGWIAKTRNGEEYLKYDSDSDWKRELKRRSARKTRREEDVPDGNGYRKYEDRWKYI